MKHSIKTDAKYTEAITNQTWDKSRSNPCKEEVHCIHTVVSFYCSFLRSDLWDLWGYYWFSGANYSQKQTQMFNAFTAHLTGGNLRFRKEANPWNLPNLLQVRQQSQGMLPLTSLLTSTDGCIEGDHVALKIFFLPPPKVRVSPFPRSFETHRRNPTSIMNLLISMAISGT